jgi:zinc transport system substrate-binding protein
MIRANHFLVSVLIILTFILVIPISLSARGSTNLTDFDDTSNKSADLSKLNLTTAAPATQESKLNIVASFYPIYEFVKQVGGDKVSVSSLIPVGIEPHDFEPTIQQIQNAENADIIFYNGLGFESSWLNKINNDNLVDTSRGTNITKIGNTVNPHIWLDPILVKTQIKNIKDTLIKLDPANQEYYENNTINFTKELDSLDTLTRSALQNCDKKDFIAFHDAFSYFANRYGLKQHSIQGVSPEGEVLPQRMQEIIELAKNLGINVVYSEELVDPRFAEVIAQEIPNGRVLILSPIEGIDSEEQASGIGYLDKMRDNIANLKIGLQCHT